MKKKNVDDAVQTPPYRRQLRKTFQSKGARERRLKLARKIYDKLLISRVVFSFGLILSKWQRKLLSVMLVVKNLFCIPTQSCHVVKTVSHSLKPPTNPSAHFYTDMHLIQNSHIFLIMFIITSLKSLLLIPIYSLSITKSLLQTSLSILHNLFTNHNHNFFSTTTLVDHLLSFYFSYHGLKPCTINLHDQDHTSIHIWIPNHPTTTTTTTSRPAIVLLHGYGGNAKWQLYKQIGPLSRDFDLYVPDLVFFGNSHSKSLHRTVSFQARSVMEAVRRVGVERVAAVFGVSYGGYVAYRMAEMYGEDVVEKVVVVSSGIGCTEEQRVEELRKFGGIDRVVEILVPENPKDLRMLMDLAFCRPPLAPTFVLRDFINVMGTAYRNERRQILHELLTVDSGHPCPVLEQETLILWGDKDKVFPMFLAYQLARHLGKKSRVEILKDAGHAANLEAADGVNRLVKSFVLDSFV